MAILSTEGCYSHLFEQQHHLLTAIFCTNLKNVERVKSANKYDTDCQTQNKSSASLEVDLQAIHLIMPLLFFPDYLLCCFHWNLHDYELLLQNYLKQNNHFSGVIFTFCNSSIKSLYFKEER